MHQVKSTETANRVRMEARLPVSFRHHAPELWQQSLGAAAPNPAKLSQLDRLWFSPLNPLRGLLPSRPPGEAGGISFALGEFQLASSFNTHPQLIHLK